MQTDSPALIARTWKEIEASVIKSLLEGYDIPCHYSSMVAHSIHPVNLEGLAEICIYVPAHMADEARLILEEHRRTYNHLRLVEPDFQEQ